MRSQEIRESLAEASVKHRRVRVEGASYGQGPVLDRDAPADRSLHPGARCGARGERELGLQALASLPPRGPGRASSLARGGPRPPPHVSPISTRTRSCAGTKSSTTTASTPEPRRSTSTSRSPERHVPSVSTIQRVLRAEASSPPTPRSDPSAADPLRRRFPNECWQGDVTHVEVAHGVVFEVFNMIDDHSRLCVASQAFVTTKRHEVVRTLHKAAEHWGYPRRFSLTRAHLQRRQWQ